MIVARRSLTEADLEMAFAFIAGQEHPGCETTVGIIADAMAIAREAGERAGAERERRDIVALAERCAESLAVQVKRLPDPGVLDPDGPVTTFKVLLARQDELYRLLTALDARRRSP